MEKNENQVEQLLNEIKQELQKQNFNTPNLELEVFKIPVTTGGTLQSLDFKTKIEHNKVVGIFTALKGAADAASVNFGSQIRISIDSKPLVSNDMFQFFLLEKNNYSSISQVAWKTDFAIQSSDVKIEYKDGSNVNPPYTAYVYFICQKKN